MAKLEELLTTRIRGMRIYLDNAASTAPYPEVLEAMLPYLGDAYGNPSSTHETGRKARVAIEQARKTIAKLVGAAASEIIFTSGGSEANNIFLQGIAPEVTHIIGSPLEHPSVLETLKYLEENHNISISWLAVEKNGKISFDSLKVALEKNPNALVCLMHGNNEIGNLLPLNEVTSLCETYNATLFTDAVQTIGHYTIDVHKNKVLGLGASAHKFHGPKGVGFLYLKQGTKLHAIYQGGEQERSLKPGTENVAGIVGMAKALELSSARIETNRQHIALLKSTLTAQLKENFTDIKFNGTSEDIENSLYTILSADFPPHLQNEMLLFKLDLAGISVSAGSACASGATKESHVLAALGHDSQRAVVRFSFAATNTIEEINTVCATLREIYN